MEVIFLGTGASPGVPCINGYWGLCDPKIRQNSRTRASIIIRFKDGFTLLVDAAPDLRTQCLREHIQRVDAVLCTHAHADHMYGLHDLRIFANVQGAPIPVYGTAETLEALQGAFAYAFHGHTGYEGDRRMVEARPIEAGAAFSLAPHLPMIQTLAQRHGIAGESLGLRCGKFAYTTDMTEFLPSALPYLENLDVWVIGVLTRKPHPTHAHLEQALQWVAQYKPGAAFLTHLGGELDYAVLVQELPQGVQPAFDGLRFQVKL